ncbi:MAG: TatD family hydrolase [Candidatus Bathyarchaeia archaeon]
MKVESYGNSHPSPLVREFLEKGRSETCPVIDMHAHLGPYQGIYFPNPSAEDMVRTMDRCGVRLVVSSSHAALIDTRENIKMEDTVRRYPNRFRAYWVINPNYPERIKDEIETFSKSKGFVGFKFLSDYHRHPLTSPRYERALEYANERRLLVLMHTWGGSPFDSPSHVEQLARKYSEAMLLMGHSGYGEWEKAIKLARDYQNVYLELTAAYAINGVIEWMVKEAGSEKILFGTDLPWFDPHYGIGCVIFSKIGDEDRHNILHRNAERLLAPYLSF